MKKWLIIYDIKDARRLSKVMKIVSEYAVRVQRSVYEMEDTIDIVNKIKERLDKVIDNDVDFVVYFNICESDWQKREKYGSARELESQADYYII
jgi:CRISPR-associated protein Cas2